MAYRSYLEKIHAKFGFHATWLPDQAVAVGDVGVVEGGQFKRKTTLASLNVPFHTRDGKVRIDLAHSSGAGVDFKAGAGAAGPQVPGLEARARAEIAFSESGGFVFRAAGCAERTLEDQVDVEEAILDLFRDKVWREEWVLVDRVYEARSLTVLVCESEQGSVTLSAKGKVDTPTFDLADADLGLSASVRSGEVTQLLAQRSLTPLYQASRVRHSWWRADRLVAAPEVFGGGLTRVSLEDALDQPPGE